MPWLYSTGFSYASSGTTSVLASYRLNGPYDPDQGAGGDQPRGYDQLAAIYGAYRVLRANVRLEFTAASQSAAYVGFRVRRGTAAASSGYTAGVIAQQPFTKIGLLPVSGVPLKAFDFSVDPAAIWGMTQAQLHQDPGFGSATTTVPLNEVYLDVIGVNLNGTATSQTVLIRIDYDVEFYVPKLLADA